jgi:outer membrane protein assembly factor BamB
MSWKQLSVLCVCLIGFCLPVQARGKKVNLDEWTQYYGSADHNNFRPIQDRIGYPVVLWEIEEGYSVPAVFKGKVYVTGKSLRMADLKTGKVLGEVVAGKLDKDEDPRNQIYYGGTPATDGKAVFAVKSTGVVESHSLDLKNVNWSTDVSDKGAPGWGIFPPALAKDILVLASSNVVALDAASGKILWTFEAPTGPVEMAPAVWGTRVIFGSKSGSLYCLDLKTGNKAWTVDAKREFGWTNPVIANGVVYIADRGAQGRKGAINAFSAVNGKELWCQPFGSTGASTPGMGPKSLYLGFSKFVGEFNLKTGKPGASQGYRTDYNPFGTPTLVGKSLIFGNLDGNLYVFDAKSERLKWRFEVKPKDGEEAQVQGFCYLKKGILLVATTRGLFAIGQRRGKRSCPGGYVLSK